MDELTNRSRTFAEAVVTMVWLVLLAAALEGKSEVTVLDVPKYVLILAGPTIVTGIGPLLACCIFKNQRAISDAAALLSAAILFSLACWIALFTVWDLIVVCVAGVSLACMVFRMTSYWMSCTGKNAYPPRSKDFHIILDGSHEFSCCLTGIHFLWLESLALQGLTSKGHGIHNDLSEAMGIVNIFFCAIGLCIMHVEMTPPHKSTEMGDIANPIFWFDTLMIFSIFTVLGAAMCKSLVVPWLLPRILGTLLIFGLVLITFKHMCFLEEAGGGENREPPKKVAAGKSEKTEPPKLAPLGLTKLMVTGFLAVYISIDSTDQLLRYWFLAFAAAAILSGLSWRLLTHDHVRKVLENNELFDVPIETRDDLIKRKERIDETAAVASYAKTACFCTHTFVAIAAVLLVIEIYNVKQSTSAAAPAPAPART